MKRCLIVLLTTLILTSQLSGCSLSEKVVNEVKNYASDKLIELSNDEEFIEKFNTVCDRGANVFISVVFKERPEGECNE